MVILSKWRHGFWFFNLNFKQIIFLASFIWLIYLNVFTVSNFKWAHLMQPVLNLISGTLFQKRLIMWCSTYIHPNKEGRRFHGNNIYLGNAAFYILLLLSYNSHQHINIFGKICNIETLLHIVGVLYIHLINEWMLLNLFSPQTYLTIKLNFFSNNIPQGYHLINMHLAR